MDGDRPTPLPGSSLPSGDSASSRDGVGFRAASFRIDGWTVVPQAHELVRPGETAHLEPRPMEVLVYLAERAGEAVSREDLMEAVWPGVFVSEHALNRCVSQLRKLFDDDARAPRVIETIPKAGYRLIAPVERVGDGVVAPLDALDMRVTPSTAPRPVAAAPPRRWGWAVLGLLVLGAVLVVALFVRPRTVAPTTRSLTVAAGVEFQAAWSPDGARLAYIHVEDGLHRVYVRALGTDAPVRLTDGPRDSAPVWSPDGSRIAFVRCEETACAVYAVDALGGEPRRMLDESARIQSMDWSPDGTTLVLAEADSVGGRLRLVLADLQTGVRRRLVDPAEGQSDIEPVFAPDGQWVLFERRGPSGGDLFRVPVEGGDLERITDDGALLAGHTWAADGRSIVFSSVRSGVYALWRVPSVGGAIEPVIGPAVRDPGGPVMAPDGQRMVVGDWQFEINLWRSVDGGAPERLIASSLWDKQPALAPDGTRLAFISNRTGPPELWTADASGDGLMRLTDFGGPAVEHPRFAPDGRSLAFQARSEGHADIWLVDTEGGPPRRLTDDPAEDLGPRFSQDGRSVYFGSNRGGRWQVWRVPVEGGTPEPVADGIAGEEAPDGALLVARRDEAGLWKVQDGEARRVASTPAIGDWANWTATERGLWSLDRPSGDVVRVDAETGAEEALGLDLGALMEGEGTFAVSAEGDTVIWARIDRIECDLLLVEPFE